MANEELAPSLGSETSFVSSAANQASDSAYSDFFQETSDGQISMGPKAEKSGLEIATTIFGYLVPITILATALLSAHVYLKTLDDTTIVEKYDFICKYINGAVPIDEADKKCKSLPQIETDYQVKITALTEETIKYLNEYLPIKISKNLLATSPEKAFIVKTFQRKLDVRKIMQEFYTAVDISQWNKAKNIICTGVSITQAGNVTSQCTVYGMGVGETGDGLSSSRIEALRFLENFSNTKVSHFILNNPPASVGASDSNDPDGIFQTQTSVSIDAQYIDPEGANVELP